MESDQAWRALRFFNYYRLILIIFLLFTVSTQQPINSFGVINPGLFFFASSGYLFFALASLITLYQQRPQITIQVQIHALSDILFLTLLIHASGGLSSGLEILLVVAVAGDALLMEGKLAYLLAAMATFAVLAEQSAYAWNKLGKGSYTQAGLLGASFFATAILARLLAQRVRESEDLAHQRGIDLANLTELNAHIIQQMNAGVIVVDGSNQIRLINSAAWELLAIAPRNIGIALVRLCPELARQVASWRADPNLEMQIFRPLPEGNEILPRFSLLGKNSRAGLLITLEDAAALAEHAQQMKLAALGRLTASIAHEIRNPLSALSHAAQLLEESPDINSTDQRLTRIIYDQTRRVNRVIENVLLLSRRGPVDLEDWELKPFLEEIASDCLTYPEASNAVINVCVNPPEISAHFNRSQMRQVLDNLCRNALRHACRSDGTLNLRLEAGKIPHQGTWIEVIDDGPGIPEEKVQQIFEPFFTTRRDGTGLGLYLARELCEANYARLTYHAITEGGSRFRIRFIHQPDGA